LKLSGVPKGISFDYAQDKFTPIVPLEGGMSWPVNKTEQFLKNILLRRFPVIYVKKGVAFCATPFSLWRPQPDAYSITKNLSCGYH
jgi:hypothetical protein